MRTTSGLRIEVSIASCTLDEQRPHGRHSAFPAKPQSRPGRIDRPPGPANHFCNFHCRCCHAVPNAHRRNAHHHLSSSARRRHSLHSVRTACADMPAACYFLAARTGDPGKQRPQSATSDSFRLALKRKRIPPLQDAHYSVASKVQRASLPQCRVCRAAWRTGAGALASLTFDFSYAVLR